MLPPSSPHPDHRPHGYGDAAPLYVAAGWAGVLPLPAGRKVWPPRGWTGRVQRWPNAARIGWWMRQEPDGNVALRLPPTVVGLDLDLYKESGRASYAALITECGPLPPTWVSTSRTDGSGVRLFRAPAGVRWAEGRAGDGIELVHAYHRFVVVWPSLHPQGRRYVWHQPDGQRSGRVPAVAELPALPVIWGRRLSELPAAPRPATVDTHVVPASGGRGLAVASLAGAVAELAGMRAGSGRNNALNRKAFALAGYVAAGDLELAVVRQQLYRAAEANGHVDRHGPRQTLATIESGLRAGLARPRRGRR
jgi:hypothetical protein